MSHEILMRTGLRWRKRWRPYLFIAPVIIVGFVMIVYPLLYSLRISLTDYNLQLQTKKFVGLDNYIGALRDAQFRNAVINTLVIAVPGLTLQFLLGLGLALAIDRIRTGRGVIVTLLLMPMMIPSAAAALSFGMLYIHRYGPINNILSMLFRQPVNIEWLGSVRLVKYSIVLVDTWQMTSFVMVFLLAGLSTIPTELYDAAKVDGASSLQTFRFITWPLLRTSVIAVLSIRLIDLLKMFGVPYMLTGGGPGLASQTISMQVIDTGFSFLRVGAGAAQSYLLLFMEALLVGLFLRFSRRREILR
jgi:ABC-type sugar transport system permease subunit